MTDTALAPTFAAPSTLETLARDFLAARSPATLRSYASALQQFARWLGAPSVGDAARDLIERGPAGANAVAAAYRAAMLERGHASGTVAQRLSSLRSLVRFARRLGLISWHLEVDPVRVRTYRDTRGPGLAGVQAILDATRPADRPLRPRDLRDRALVRLLFDAGLRRQEVQTLDVEHVDLAAARVSVLQKGDRERGWIDLAPVTVAAVADWIEARGRAPGPLFVRERSGHLEMTRLSLCGVNAITTRLGIAAGVPGARPHGFRHTAVTTALDATGGDVRSVQQFSRHRDVRTVQRYDDARLAAGVGALVAAAVA